jgi:hypothetical protein
VFHHQKEANVNDHKALIYGYEDNLPTLLTACKLLLKEIDYLIEDGTLNEEAKLAPVIKYAEAAVYNAEVKNV